MSLFHSPNIWRRLFYPTIGDCLASFSTYGRGCFYLYCWCCNRIQTRPLSSLPASSVDGSAHIFHVLLLYLLLKMLIFISLLSWAFEAFSSSLLFPPLLPNLSHSIVRILSRISLHRKFDSTIARSIESEFRFYCFFARCSKTD